MLTARKIEIKFIHRFQIYSSIYKNDCFRTARKCVECKMCSCTEMFQDRWFNWYVYNGCHKRLVQIKSVEEVVGQVNSIWKSV